MLICWSPIQTLPKAFLFQNMCIGQNPVDPLIDNFGNLANSGKVKFWTSSSPKRCWFVDHQYRHYLRLSISKICAWVRILLICWLAIFQILTSVEKSNFEPIALQNGVDLLITNWHCQRLAIFQICVWVQNLLIRWLTILVILQIVEKSNFKPIALQNGVDLLTTNTGHHLRKCVYGSKSCWSVDWPFSKFCH